jgi:hypothetical protein
MREVGADGVGPTIDELLGQVEPVEGLIPELLLRRRVEDARADARQRRSHDEGAQQAGPVRRDGLRYPAADVIAGEHHPGQAQLLDQRQDAAGLGGRGVRRGRIREMLVRRAEPAQVGNDDIQPVQQLNHRAPVAPLNCT